MHFWKNDFYTYYRLQHFGSLNIWDFFFRSASEREMGIFSMIWQLLPLTLPSTIFIALSLFLNYHRCLF